MKGNVSITKNYFLQLQLNTEILDRLYCGGVDNWDWYNESLNPDDKPNMDDFEELEKIRISKV